MHKTEENIVKEYSHSHFQVLSFKGEHATISGIGIIHGLASNDELLLLLTLSLGLNEFSTMLFGVLVFTIGVVIGMIAFGTLLRLPFSKFGRERIVKIVNLTIATLTLIYAFYIIFGGGTINLLPFIGENLEGALISVAFILGIKHSMDADHVVAISSILLRSSSLMRTISLSIAWAIGHMLTASVITYLLFTFRETLLEALLANFESLVAIMLIAIAILTYLWEFDIIQWGKHSHGHQHSDGTIHNHN